MTTQRKNFDRAYKLHAACALREMRTELAYICFRNDVAYCNNGHMAVRAKLKKISNFHPEEYKKLNGKCIHMDNFRRLLNYQVANITENGFEVNDNGRRLLIYFGELEIIDLNGDMDNIFERCKADNLVGVHTTGIRESWLRIAAAAMGSDVLKMEYYDGGNGRLFTNIYNPASPIEIEALIYEEVLKQ